jgi:pimeloyl-ACP methyl ester carboxylesterase
MVLLVAFERAGHGAALVLVDAASCFREFGPMRSLSQVLKDEFTVYIYDRRGRGESTDTPPYGVDNEVDDLRVVIEAAGESS